jgi:DNA-binding NtrC family response regulator
MAGSGRILVVEDETGIRDLISELLSINGYDVATARDGKDSLDQLDREDFDLVITDIHMPRVDGIEMIKTMQKAGREEKIIVMTGDLSDPRLPEMNVPKVVKRFQKPFRLESLLIEITQAIGINKRLH